MARDILDKQSLLGKLSKYVASAKHSIHLCKQLAMGDKKLSLQAMYNQSGMLLVKDEGNSTSIQPDTMFSLSDLQNCSNSQKNTVLANHWFVLISHCQ